MDYYCSTKFTDLMVSVEKRELYNCCLAYPERVNLDWLAKNPGKLFYTPTMIKDRQLMLQNKSCKSCDFGCYRDEKQGKTSGRSRAEKIQIDDVFSPLKSLQILLSSDCNLTCAYCNSDWSSSWRRDLDKNGEYSLHNFKLENSNWTKLLSKVKQKQRTTQTNFFQLLLREIKLAKNLELVSLLGGEPLLHNDIDKIIDVVKDKKIHITTGLGVSNNRLLNFLNKYKGQKNILFNVSCESTGKTFEFLRYGNKWQEFVDKIKMITDKDFTVRFFSTITNISLLDFHNFYDKFYKDHTINFANVQSRPFFSSHILDDNSKNTFKKWQQPHTDLNVISQTLDLNIAEYEKINCYKFIQEFSKRRNIDLDFLPKHFLNWLKASS